MFEPTNLKPGDLARDLAAQLAELMGGSIWLESASGAGSTFHGTIWCDDFASSPSASGKGRPATASSLFSNGCSPFALPSGT